jgi:PPK2 family polyphosphate:nucleotide phosphotransferase
MPKAHAAEMIDELMVRPGEPARLAERNPASRLGLSDKVDGQARVVALQLRLDELHDRLWAEAQRSVVLVLQGMDASGKDGTIRHVLTGLNPQGCTVSNFKVPTDVDRAHDYLWRIHRAMPARGLLGVFNRSHYEDVVAAPIARFVDDEHCTRRYRHIREFERMLADEGTTMVKVFLHISKEEQRARLQERIDDPRKSWKFHRSDLEVRARWDEFHRRYDAAISATSSDWAPWYVVPSDHKWVRNVAVAETLVRIFERLDPRIPDPEPGLEGMTVD